MIYVVKKKTVVCVKEYIPCTKETRECVVGFAFWADGVGDREKAQLRIQNGFVNSCRWKKHFRWMHMDWMWDENWNSWVERRGVKRDDSRWLDQSYTMKREEIFICFMKETKNFFYNGRWDVNIFFWCPLRISVTQNRWWPRWYAKGWWQKRNR